MDLTHMFLFAALVIFAAAIDGTQAAAMVSGAVYCDQCKDGQRSLFDYPLSGTKVTITCSDGNGQVTMSREETTNAFGNYVMRFDGTPDLSNCNAQVSGRGEGLNNCGATPGAAQKLRLMFRMFGTEIFGVDSLLSEPAQPMSFCPNSSNPVVTPTRPSGPRPTPPTGSPRTFRPPRLPPLPPLPFSKASACSHQYWTKPEYKCYWRVLNPETKVSLIFGPLAARRYGTDMTLWESLGGRGDPYKTLLREATTALLNSYNSLQFPYNSVGVVTHTNWALMGSTRGVLITGLRFIRANSGSGTGVTCNLTPCK
ncbi:hypothetical protein GQ457_18G018010 [Hibiscus cannabinus]